MAVPAPEPSDRDAVQIHVAVPAVAPKAAPGLLVQLLTAGCAACVADVLTFPLDTIKVRLQIQGEAAAAEAAAAAGGHRGVWSALLAVARQEGVASLYNGLVPGLQRQMAFSAVRIGAYDSFKNYYQELTGIDHGLGLMLIRVSAGTLANTLAVAILDITIGDI